MSSDSDPPAYPVVFITLENWSLVLGAITLVQLLWFCYFLFVKNKGSSIVNAAPAEKLLMFMGLDLTALYFLTSQSYYQPEPTAYIVINTFFYVMMQLFYSLYLSLAWIRSKPIMQILYPRYHEYLGYFVIYAFPVLMLFPIPIWSLWDWDLLLTGESNYQIAAVFLNYLVPSILGACDLFLLISFIMFLNRTRVHENDAIEPKFQIIAYYSSVASFLMITVVITGFASTFIIDPTANSIFYFLTQILVPGMIWFVLTLMKAHLVYDEQRESFGLGLGLKSSSDVSTSTPKRSLFKFFSSQHSEKSRPQ